MIIYAICLPVAIFLGYLLVNTINDPYGSRASVAVIALALFLMTLPLFLRWHHAWLIAVWNSTLLFVFLPGQPMGWTIMAVISFGLAVSHYILNREKKLVFTAAPSVALSLIFVAIVVFITAKLRGGIGLHVLGDENMGGKRYILIWVSIAGYFALTSQAIAPDKRKLMAVIFLLGGATAIISDVAGLIGGPLTYISVIFPVTDASSYGFSRNAVAGAEEVERFGGIANGCLAISMALVGYFGIERILDLKKPWRLVAFGAALVLTMFGGFRGLMIICCLTLVLIFYWEGLCRTRFLPLAILTLLLFGAVAVAFSDRMPYPVQRSIAFLPIKLSQPVRDSAEGSKDWRLEIWRSVLPDIPRYLWLGKGLGVDFKDLASYYDFGNAQVGGEIGGGFAAAGDYHSGPLSLIIQFGIWGVLGFLWFLWASIKVFWANYKYGDPELKRLNTCLLAMFIAKIFTFFVIFGGFYSDITVFVGLIGFSVSMNGGVAKPAPVVRPKIVFNRFRPLPLPATTG